MSTHEQVLVLVGLAIIGGWAVYTGDLPMDSFGLLLIVRGLLE